MAIEPGVQLIPSQFHWEGREGQTPKWLIIHGTAGGTTAVGIADWFQNPQAQASTNYVIGTDGTIIASVDEDNAPWANGALTAGHDAFWDTLNGVNPNLVTISIEHCKASQDNSDQLTQPQKEASFRLVQSICERHNIPKHLANEQGGITSHASIDPVNRSGCPGPYPWDDLFAYLNAIESTPPKEQPMNTIPDGWKDDGTHLVAPNTIAVVRGFRDYVLSHTWDKENWPLQPEVGLSHLELSNIPLGGGTQQVFRMKMLGWTTKRGVFEEWMGQELLFLRNEIEKDTQSEEATKN